MSKKMSKKIHLLKKTGFGTYNQACGRIQSSGFNSVKFKDFLNTSPEKRCKTCENSNFFNEQLAKQESKRPLEKEEFEEPKTQLQIDTKKYNLNEEQVEYLSGFEYQIRDNYDYCDGCLFSDNKINCDNIWCKDEKIFVFKQIHKTQKSLNEAIEKESNKEPVKEPYTWVNEPHSNKIKIDKNITLIEDENDKIIWVRPPEYNPADVAFKTENKQQADHYKNGVETIKKIETILSMLGEDITPRQGYLIGNFIKYIDRLGLKDDKEKDAYKASDYLNRLIYGEWIYEK